LLAVFDYDGRVGALVLFDELRLRRLVRIDAVDVIGQVVE
jgi:hypothetical protein